jgi:hypothetical protein
LQFSQLIEVDDDVNLLSAHLHNFLFFHSHSPLFATFSLSVLLFSFTKKISIYFHLLIVNFLVSFCVPFSVYQDMEKDNKSVPLRVFSNSISNYPIDTKTTVTSILQQQQGAQPQQQQASHRHAIHSRLTDIQMCSNDIIDLSSSSQNENAGVNLNAQSRSYDVSKINANMMSIYDVNGSNISNFGDINAKTSGIVNNLDILKGISKGE